MKRKVKVALVVVGFLVFVFIGQTILEALVGLIMLLGLALLLTLIGPLLGALMMKDAAKSGRQRSV